MIYNIPDFLKNSDFYDSLDLNELKENGLQVEHFVENLSAYTVENLHKILLTLDYWSVKDIKNVLNNIETTLNIVYECYFLVYDKGLKISQIVKDLEHIYSYKILNLTDLNSIAHICAKNNHFPKSVETLLINNKTYFKNFPMHQEKQFLNFFKDSVEEFNENTKELIDEYSITFANQIFWETVHTYKDLLIDVNYAFVYNYDNNDNFLTLGDIINDECALPVHFLRLLNKKNSYKIPLNRVYFYFDINLYIMYLFLGICKIFKDKGYNCSYDISGHFEKIEYNDIIGKTYFRNARISLKTPETLPITAAGDTDIWCLCFLFLRYFSHTYEAQNKNIDIIVAYRKNYLQYLYLYISYNNKLILMRTIYVISIAYCVYELRNEMLYNCFQKLLLVLFVNVVCYYIYNYKTYFDILNSNRYNKTIIFYNYIYPIFKAINILYYLYLAGVCVEYIIFGTINFYLISIFTGIFLINCSSYNYIIKKCIVL